MAARYIFRLDDIAPNMHWENYLRLKEIFDSYAVKPILGIIPDNQDPELLALPTSALDFWQELRSVRDSGWEIAQHGYQHKYTTRCSGILGINPRSEFAGLAFDIQRDKLRKGQDILQAHGLGCETFMAPAHSLDEVTLEAMAALGMTTVTDGFALYPYRVRGLLFVPQLLARPRWFPIGVHTWCIHLNELAPSGLERIESFVSRYRESIIPFSQAGRFLSDRPLNRRVGDLLRLSLLTARRARRGIAHMRRQSVVGL